MFNSFAKIISDQNRSAPLLKRAAASLTVETADALLAEMFGPEIKNHARAAYLKQETLYIACLSSAAAQEIRLREAELRRLLSSHASSVPIRKISCIL